LRHAPFNSEAERVLSGSEMSMATALSRDYSWLGRDETVVKNRDAALPFQVLFIFSLKGNRGGNSID